MTRDELIKLLMEHRHLFAGLDKGRAMLYCSCGATVAMAGDHDVNREEHCRHLADILIDRLPTADMLF